MAATLIASIQACSSLRSNTVVLVCATSLLLLATGTRLFTEFLGSSSANAHQLPPVVPYWIPGFGNVLAILRRPGKDLATARSKYRARGAFTVNILGRKHTVIFGPEYVQAELDRRKTPSRRDCEEVLLSRIGGLKAASVEKTKKCFEPNSCLGCGATLETKFTDEVVRRLQKKLPDLVSGNTSVVDQMIWEREAAAEVRVGRGSKESTVTESDFFALISSFIVHLMLESLMPGTPPATINDLVPALNAMNIRISPLFWGIPRWLAFVLPFPAVHAAYRARDEVVSVLGKYHQALDDLQAGKQLSPHWIGLDSHDAGGTQFGIRRSRMKSHQVSVNDRAKADATWLWFHMKEAAPLVFWMLVNALTSPAGTASQVRKEAQASVAVEEQSEMIPGSGIREPPKVRIREDLLSNLEKTPALHTMLAHVLQDHFKGMAFRKISQDETLRTSSGNELKLVKGTFVAIAHESLPQPVTAHGLQTRALNTTTVAEQDTNVASKGPSSSSIDSDPACTMIPTLISFVLAATAGILVLWDIKPAQTTERWSGRRAAEGSWGDLKMPETLRTEGVDVPKTDIRVRIQRYPPD